MMARATPAWKSSVMSRPMALSRPDGFPDFGRISESSNKALDILALHYIINPFGPEEFQGTGRSRPKMAG
jgi:hypothetical protein